MSSRNKPGQRDLDYRWMTRPAALIAGRDLMENENDNLQVNTEYAFMSGIVDDVIVDPYDFLNRNYGNTDFLLKDVLSGRIKTSFLFEEDNTANPGERKRANTSPADLFVNPQMIETMPMNSIFAYVIDERRSKDDPRLTICYPFFPGHLSLPLNSGEYVWIVKEMVGDNAYYYWLSRKVGARQVDDLNYTNYERLTRVNDILDESFNQKGNVSTGAYVGALSLDEKSSISLQGLVDSRSNFPIPAQQILKNSYSYNMGFTGEPVPRLKKNSGDLLLQGSNNAGIHITTEKFSENIFNSSLFRPIQLDGIEAQPQRKPQSSAIDLFVNRKKDSLDRAATTLAPKSTLQNESDKVKLVENDSSSPYFEYIENNKLADIMKSDLSIFDNEINDTKDDATDIGARLYMSHNCDVDNVFGFNFDNMTDNTKLGPCIVSYAKHNRILGDEDVRIVSKIGESYIDLDDTGNVIIKSSINDGQQFLSLGSSGDSRLHAAGKTRIQSQDEIYLTVREDPTDEEPPTEPYVLYSELRDLLDKITGDLAFYNTLIETVIMRGVLSPFGGPAIMDTFDQLREGAGASGTLDMEADLGLDPPGDGEPPYPPVSTTFLGGNITMEKVLNEISTQINDALPSTKIFGE